MKNLITQLLLEMEDTHVQEPHWSGTDYLVFKEIFSKETYSLHVNEEIVDQNVSLAIKIEPLSNRIGSRHRAFEICRKLCDALKMAYEQSPKHRLKTLYQTYEFLNLNSSIFEKKSYSVWYLMKRAELGKIFLYVVLSMIPLGLFITSKLFEKKEDQLTNEFLQVLYFLASLLSPFLFTVWMYVFCKSIYSVYLDYHLIKRNQNRGGV